MSDNDAAVLKPWTLKSIDTRVSDDIVAEARRTGINASQMVERAWAAWKASGSPVQMPAPLPAGMSDLAALLQAAGPFTADNPMPGQVRSLINDIARSSRGVSPRHPVSVEAKRGNGVARIAERADGR